MRQIALSDRHKDARRVLRWIKDRSKTEVSRDEIRENALAKKLDAAGTQELLIRLEKAGWLKAETIVTAGRPKIRWHVNPQLFA
jgi:hypothetical protein